MNARFVIAALAVSLPLQAQEAGDEDEDLDAAARAAEQNATAAVGYTPAAQSPATTSFRLTGYVDVGTLHGYREALGLLAQDTPTPQR